MNAPHNAPRWSGYLSIVLTSPNGRETAHLLEFSRHGGLLSITHELPANTQVTLEIDVNRKFEELMQAPDILVFNATVVDGTIDEGAFGGEHIRFSFDEDTIARYWPWLDALAPLHGMRLIDDAPVTG